MPTKPLRPCKRIGCRELTRNGYCDEHKTEGAASTRRRGASGAYRHLYQSGSYRRGRVMFLAEHPFCATCARAERTTIATELDHIIPHKGDADLFFDTSNWQGLCKRCHDRKTASGDGGFGNRPSPHLKKF